MFRPHEELPRRIAAFHRVALVVVQTATARIEVGIRGRSNLDDHTLKMLAELGHPYRVGTTVAGKEAGKAYGYVTKSGKWRAGVTKEAKRIRAGILGHDVKLVHEQSEDMQKAIYANISDSDTAIIGRVGVDPAKAPEVVYVVKGTSKMLPRDFIGQGAFDARKDVLRIVRQGLNAAIRANG